MSSLAPPAFAQSQEPAATKRRETVLFVDDRIRHPRLIVEGLDPRTKVYRLSLGGDPLSEIASIVSRAAPVGRIAILIRGDTGAFTLTGQHIERETLEHEAMSIARIRAALGAGADVLLMSCSTGAFHARRDFVSTLEAGLGVPVRTSEIDLDADDGKRNRFPVATIFAPSELASYPERLLTHLTLSGDGASPSIPAIEKAMGLRPLATSSLSAN